MPRKLRRRFLAVLFLVLAALCAGLGSAASTPTADDQHLHWTQDG